jgi:3-oxoacyl-[acyl-carrier protein] reductase
LRWSIDVLVANAGGTRTRPNQAVDEIDESGWRASIDGNLTATFLTIKSVLPGMKQRRSGSIVTISSAASRRPTPASPAPYAIAKAGIELLTQVVGDAGRPVWCEG